MRVAVYQFNPTVGDLSGNTDKIFNAITESINSSCDLFITSELAITGYSPDDLLLRDSFFKDAYNQLTRLLVFKNINLLIGCPYKLNNLYYNSAFFISNGVIEQRYDKMELPNYGVFDEHRYFNKGNSYIIVKCKNINIGVLICEDIWTYSHVVALKNNGADIICVLNASPYRTGILHQRIEMITENIKKANIPILYVNQIGGQDDIVYDGNSFAMDCNLEIKFKLQAFNENLAYLDINLITNVYNITSYHNYLDIEQRTIEYLYQALILSLTDYVKKNRFNGVVIGLSGGIDSALTLAIACDAIGKDKVTTVMMPTKFTSDISIEDALLMTNFLGIKHHSIHIDEIFTLYKDLLKDIFINHNEDTTEENLQARIRGTILMAISNKLNYLVLTTGNKSEIATGYCTLYGDMAGGFCVLKDVYKTDVYKLAQLVNSNNEIIPKRIITRAPSAELNYNQTDQDSLPDYSVLDKILTHLIEDALSSNEIIAMGYDQDIVNKISKLLNLSEYKRKQSAIGPKISITSFTKEWRYPVTNKYKF